jgi:hypothetical protein
MVPVAAPKSVTRKEKKMLHARCVLCGESFWIPAGLEGSLMIRASHCTTCANELDRRFAATLGGNK